MSESMPKRAQITGTPIAAGHAGSQETEIDLIELFFRLLENVRYIILCAVVGALVMIGYSTWIADPVYQATSKLYVLSSDDSILNLSDLQIGAYLTSDYQEVFRTWEVNEQVITNLSLPYSYSGIQSMVTVSNPTDTRILYVTVTSTNAREAADMANEYAKVARQYIADTMATEMPTVFSVALEPTRPVSPNKTMNTMMGFLVGGVLCAGIIVVMFLLDDKIKSTDDILKYTGLPTLSVVPINAPLKMRVSPYIPDHSHGKKSEKEGKQ
jgi:capsular polysaccharide biosynthesis protein